jgi:hypothetical protein
MTIKELRQSSNDFVANLDTIIASVVNFNVELEELNRKQLRASKRADDTPIHPIYSRRYAIWKRFFYPGSFGDGKVNLYLTGDFYKSLELKAKGKEYSITSDVPYAYDLASKYGDITGIAPSNQEEAQRITGELLGEKYKQLVLS